MTLADYDNAATPRGANFVGSPRQVIEKILFQHEIFRHDRFLIQFGVGAMPHAKILRSIELLGTEVAPVVRAGVARRAAETEAAAWAGDLNRRVPGTGVERPFSSCPACVRLTVHARGRRSGGHDRARRAARPGAR